MAAVSGTPIKTMPSLRAKRDWRARLFSQLRLKIVLGLVLNLCVWIPYQLLQHHSFFPVFSMPATFLDQVIPFWPTSAWLYLSVYLFTLTPIFLDKRSDLLRYAAGLLAIGILADLIFIFWPTSCPRPPWAGGSSAYDFIIAMDNPRHAFPSLHAALCFYTALWGNRILREEQVSLWVFVLLWLWTFFIFFATLTTKQHVIADLAAGTLLAWGAYACFVEPRIFSGRIPEIKRAQGLSS